MNKIYHIMVEAKDSEGSFFQNFYPKASNLDEAINEVMRILKIIKYSDVIFDCAEEMNDIFDIDHLMEVEDFNGLIQNEKHYY